MEHDSHYHRQPGVSPIRITIYPKRRLSDLAPGLRTIPPEKPLRLPEGSAAAYADFFRHSASTAPMAMFSHIVDHPETAALFEDEAKGA